MSDEHDCVAAILGALRAPPGRPRKWPWLLELVRQGGAGSFGPYKTAASADVTAHYFNRQMRSDSPQDFLSFRFRGIGQRVECVRREA